MGTPWRRSHPLTTWTSSPRSAAPLTLCVCCLCDHATLLPNLHPGLQNCPIISNPPPISLIWGHESYAYMVREALHLSPACSVWQEREAAGAHLLDPEHLIVNGLGGAFLHPTHCFAHGDAVHTCAVAAEQRECAADRSAHPWLFHDVLIQMSRVCSSLCAGAGPGGGRSVCALEPRPACHATQPRHVLTLRQPCPRPLCCTPICQPGLTYCFLNDHFVSGNTLAS